MVVLTFAQHPNHEVLFPALCWRLENTGLSLMAFRKMQQLQKSSLPGQDVLLLEVTAGKGLQEEQRVKQETASQPS